jgi:flagellar hook-basal body complex protein FliE
VSAVSGSSGDANIAVGRMLDGSGDVHEAMIALQRADVMLQLTVQIRNKLVTAYQDIMRMPV